METVFTGITIKNFQCYDDIHIDFDSERNILLGFNGVGKTTVLSAIIWCLTGKNYNNEQKFNITPRKNGVDLNDLVTSVQLDMYVDGLKFSIVRKLANRIATIEVNTVKYKVNEFETFLEDKMNLSEEETKLLMNPNYAPSLNWQDLKKIIMGFVDFDDEEILKNENEDFGAIKSDIMTVGRDKLRDTIRTNRTDFKKALNVQDGKIEQAQKMLSEDTERLGDKEKLQAEYDSIQKQIETINAKDKESQAKQKESQELKEQILSEKDKRSSIMSKLNDIKNKGLEIKSDIESLKSYESEHDNKINQLSKNIEVSKKQLDNASKEQEEYLKELDEVKAKIDTFNSEKIEVDENCPYCGQKLPDEKIKEVADKMSVDRSSKYNSLVAELKKIRDKSDNCELRISDITKEIDKYSCELVEENKAYAECNYNSKLQKLNDERTILLKDYSEEETKLKELDSKITELEAKSTNTDNNESGESTSELESKQNIIKAKLLQFEGLKDKQAGIDTLIKERVEIENNIVSNETKDKQLKRFDRLKADIITGKLSMSFKQAEFVTSEKNAKGEDVDTFKLGYHGRSYDMLSGGEKMLVGLDLCNGIQKLKDKKVPILVDCLGELSRIPDEIDTQVIGARSIEFPNKSHPQYDKIVSIYSKLAIKKGI